MPARGQIDHAALPARIRLWLLDNPGAHRPNAVAQGLGLPPEMPRKEWSRIVANAMGRLARAGTLERVDLQAEMGWKRPVSAYRLPASEPATTKGP